jgi:hypothetical protein
MSHEPPSPGRTDYPLPGSTAPEQPTRNWKWVLLVLGALVLLTAGCCVLSMLYSLVAG